MAEPSTGALAVTGVLASVGFCAASALYVALNAHIRNAQIGDRNSQLIM
ncbi:MULTISPECIES: hypothetical protein [Pseudomonas]|nr:MULTISPECIES: hypothetical protein [Pseudomonas]